MPAESKNDALAKAEPQTDKMEQVKTAIGGLERKPDFLPVSARTTGGVLPEVLYQGASTLELTDDEIAKLEAYQDAPEDDLDIRPDGLVYASHSFYRRALCEIFGAGRWALRPVTDPVIRKDGDKVEIAQTWVLCVRGGFIAQSTGIGVYWANNPKADLGDALESAQSQALSRMCAKSSLGIGANPWDKRKSAAWRQERCIKVRCRVKKGYGQNATWSEQEMWRRADGEPFDTDTLKEVKQGATQDAPPRAPAPARKAEPTPEYVEAEPADLDEALTEETPAQAEPAKAPEPKAGHSEVKNPPSNVPSAEKPVPMVGETNFRLFMARARQHGFVKADDFSGAIEMLEKALGRKMPVKPGKKEAENVHSFFMELPMETFQTKVVPALRAKEQNG